MGVYLRATKTGLVKLLRSRGHDIPSIRSVYFESHHGRAWLEWTDRAGVRRKVAFTTVAGMLVLWAEREPAEVISMAEVIHFGLYEEK